MPGFNEAPFFQAGKRNSSDLEDADGGREAVQEAERPGTDEDGIAILTTDEVGA